MARCGGKRDLETELFHIGLTVLAAGTTAWVLSGFLPPIRLPEIPCFFSSVLGFYCPGCGGTRAVKALCRGQFFRALWYHPLVPYLAVGFGGFMVTQGLHRVWIRLIRGWRFHQWYLYGAVFLILANFILKNMLRLIWGITL